MGFFSYQGQCQGGTAISGTIEASGPDDAIEQLEAMRVRVIEVEKADRPRPKRGIGHDDFVFFNDQLASLAQSGLALDEGLREIAADVRSSRLRRVIDEIADDLERGTPLDQAVAARESRLPVLYSRVIRAGVHSNQLSATLLNLSQHLRFLGESRRFVFEALSYPLVVLFVALGVFSGIVLLVLPQFESILVDFEARLPFLTEAAFAFARIYPLLLLVAVAVVAAGLFAWALARTTPGGRRMRERALQGVPLVGNLLRSSLQARFLRAVALAVNAGIPLPKTLRVAAGATGSPGLAREADGASELLERGESVGSACKLGRLIPPMFGYVAQVAADRNNLPEAMAQLAKAYEQRAAHHQSILRVWLAPAAVIFVGGAIGVCVVAVFLPLVSLIQSISGG